MYKDQPFFLTDEVAMLRFMAICQPSCDPDMYESFFTLCRQLIEIRPGWRAGCLERIEAYLRGDLVDSLGIVQPVLES